MLSIRPGLQACGNEGGKRNAMLRIAQSITHLKEAWGCASLLFEEMQVGDNCIFNRTLTLGPFTPSYRKPPNSDCGTCGPRRSLGRLPSRGAASEQYSILTLG